MDRTGKRHMGCLDDEYKLIAIIFVPRMSYLPKVMATDVFAACPEICRDTSIAQA